MNENTEGIKPTVYFDLMMYKSIVLKGKLLCLLFFYFFLYFSLCFTILLQGKTFNDTVLQSMYPVKNLIFVLIKSHLL